MRSNEILNEVQEDMSALAEDARTLPLQAVPQLRQIAAPPSPPIAISAGIFNVAGISDRELVDRARSYRTSNVLRRRYRGHRHRHRQPEISTLAEFQESIEIPELNEAAANVLLSSQFPSDAVPVQSGRRISAFVAACVGIGVVVAGITFWWLSNRNSGASGPAIASEGATTTAPSAVAPPTPQPGPADNAATPPAPSADAAGLSLVAEAVRDVWVRTTIDGRTDGGRTLSAGQVIDVSAEKSISLRAGDGGALLFSLNRGQKQPLGREWSAGDSPVRRRETRDSATGPRASACEACPDSAGKHAFGSADRIGGSCAGTIDSDADDDCVGERGAGSKSARPADAYTGRAAGKCDRIQPACGPTGRRQSVECAREFVGTRGRFTSERRGGHRAAVARRLSSSGP